MQKMWTILGSKIFYDGRWLTADQMDVIADAYWPKVAKGEIEREPALEALIKRWDEIKARKQKTPVPKYRGRKE